MARELKKPTEDMELRDTRVRYYRNTLLGPVAFVKVYLHCLIAVGAFLNMGYAEVWGFFLIFLDVSFSAFFTRFKIHIFHCFFGF